MDAVGCYVHIPYCVRKCRYCAFVSKCDYRDVNDYIAALCTEIRRAKGNRVIDTIYIGGGTPSTLPRGAITTIIQTIRDTFTLTPDCEISVEANPNSLDLSTAKEWASAGVNRVSVGLQSASSRLLRILGRIHTKKDFLSSIENLKLAGITNINADMIIGVPTEQMHDVEYTLETILKAGVTHVSCYSLILEEGTPLYDDVMSGKYKLPSDERVVDRYDYVLSRLRQAGMERYETSNFALPGYECRHNYNCWRVHEYFGFGVAAHGYIGTRYRHTESVADYIKSIADGGDGVVERVEPDKLAEYIMLGLRTSEGISLQRARALGGLYKDAKASLDQFITHGLVIKNGDNVRLSDSGYYVQNSIISELI